MVDSIRVCILHGRSLFITCTQMYSKRKREMPIVLLLMKVHFNEKRKEKRTIHRHSVEMKRNQESSINSHKSTGSWDFFFVWFFHTFFSLHLFFLIVFFNCQRDPLTRTSFFHLRLLFFHWICLPVYNRACIFYIFVSSFIGLTTVTKALWCTNMIFVVENNKYLYNIYTI